MRIDNKGKVGKVIADTYVVQFHELLPSTKPSTRHEYIPDQYKPFYTNPAYTNMAMYIWDVHSHQRALAVLTT